jgi:hypothetical protein
VEYTARCPAAPPPLKILATQALRLDVRAHPVYGSRQGGSSEIVETAVLVEDDDEQVGLDLLGALVAQLDFH